MVTIELSNFIPVKKMLISNLTMAVLRVTMVHDMPGLTDAWLEYESLRTGQERGRICPATYDPL